MKQLGLGFVRERRKRKRRAGSGVPHRRRVRFERRSPVHVTLKMAKEVWNLRSRRSVRVLQLAMLGGAERFGARVVQASVQGNHCHLLVEADNTAALVRGMKGLSIRIARGLNKMMGRTGRVLGDRYHSRILETATEVRRVVHYIRHNHRQHLEPKGEHFPPNWTDPYSEAFTLPTPRTWLVREAKPPGP
jgi:putative transposase